MTGSPALIGTATVAAVAALAGRAWRRLGDDVIEWAADDGGIWLLQSQRAMAPGRRRRTGPEPRHGGRAAVRGAGTGRGAEPGCPPRARRCRCSRPPCWAAASTCRDGREHRGRPPAGWWPSSRTSARPATAGTPSCWSDQPLPALAPLLFAARGVIARTGAAGSHLAEVARSLGVPMVLGCRPERVTGTPAVPDGAFLAAIDGSTGDVALLPATGDWPAASPGSGISALSGLHHPASARPVPGPSGQRI